MIRDSTVLLAEFIDRMSNGKGGLRQATRDVFTKLLEHGDAATREAAEEALQILSGGGCAGRASS